MALSKQSNRYFFYRRLVISLTVFGFLYILVIRPVQIILMQDYLLPLFYSILNPVGDIIASPGKDEFFLESITGAFPQVKIEMPFNGYFWLAMALIWPSKNKQFSRVIWVYNGLLFLIIPIIAFGMIMGINWIAFLANIHERVYKAIFLILGVIAVNQSATTLQD